MKILTKLKKETNQIYLLAIIIYVIGVLCDGFGYVHNGIEFLSYIFLGGFAIFGSALVIISSNKNSEYVKKGIIHLCFLVISIIVVFIFNFLNMGQSAFFTGVFGFIIGFLFMYDLLAICCIYNDNGFNE